MSLVHNYILVALIASRLRRWESQKSRSQSLTKRIAASRNEIGGSSVFFEAEPRFGVKVISRLTQPQNRKDEPITPDYFRTLWITIFVFRLNLPSFYLWVSLITYKRYKAEADTGMWITQKALQYNKMSLYLCVIEIHALCFFSFLCSLFVLLLTTLTLRG